MDNAEEIRRRLAELRWKLPPKFEEQCMEALNFIETGNTNDAFRVLIEMLLLSNGDEERVTDKIIISDGEGKTVGTWKYYQAT